jgi:uncharacterized repeat protein (TIGR03803 family)
MAAMRAVSVAGAAFCSSRSRFQHWTGTVLNTFNGTTDGEFPNPVILDGAGHLFGTAVYGGSHKLGTIFKFTP